MESPTHASFKVPDDEPGTPLRQLSCEQMNHKNSGVNIPQSPSIHTHGPDGLLPSWSPRQRESVSGSPSGTRSPLRRDAMPPPPLSPSKRDALERTMVGYEESQKLIARANEEIDQLRATIKGQAKQLSMTGARIEKLMEQLGNEKQQNEEMRIKYVHEVKKMRKQCFQTDKAHLELQGELADVKKELRKKEADLAHAKQRREEAKQEAFERAYAIAGLTEEMEVMRERMKVLEQEKEAAEQERDAAEQDKAAALQEKEAAMQEKEAAVQELRNHARRWAGRIEQEASSASRRAHEMVRIASQSEELAENEAAQVAVSKRRNVRQPEHHCQLAASTVARPFFSDFVEYKAGERALFGEVFTLEDHVIELYREVAYYRRELSEAKEEIDLMCMECQLQICECRRAEKQGKRFIHDVDFNVKLQDERAAKKQRLEEDNKAQTLPPVPSAEESMHPDHHAALELARQVPLPEQDQWERESRESTATATAALEEMTQVLVAPTHTDADLKFTFSVSCSYETHHHHQPAAVPPLLPRSESATESSDMDMFDLSPPKNEPRRPSTALGIRSSYVESPMRLVPELGRATTDKGHTIESMSRHVGVRDTTTTTAQRSAHRRAHSRPNIRPESRTRSPATAATLTKPELTNGRSTTPGSPANSTIFPITPKTKAGSLHARSQTVSAVPMMHASQSFTTRTTTTRVPLRSGHDEEEEEEAAAAARMVMTAPTTMKSRHDEYPRTPKTTFDGRESQSSGPSADKGTTRSRKVAQCEEDSDGDKVG
ncbi:hypothetical protein DV738_g2098, partial [Chaetothyriales sp. CBS 135597]